MSLYSLNGPIQTQLSELQNGMDALRSFANQHPHLHPWVISPMTTSVHFPSTAADQLRDTFGREGWVIDNRVIFRMEGPVRVELQLPQTVPNPQPFTL